MGVLRDVLRPGPPSDVWRKMAFSVLVATAVPNLLLLALGRLDLAIYTMAGSFCALYGHGLPYAARLRAVGGVVLGMLGSSAVALTAASLTSSTAALIAVGALLAAAQKAVCDATRIGPPGPVIFTFISSAALFLPGQNLAGLPGHLGLTAATGLLALAVCLAPALVRPDGPERLAVARALEAAARLAESGTGRARHGAAAAVHAAWQSLAAARPGASTAALGRLVAAAETVPGAPREDAAGPLRRAATRVRGHGPVPAPPFAGNGAPGGGVRYDGRLVTGPFSLALALRTLAGSALAGYAAAALGVGRPYWAIVTAAALCQANVTLTWHRGVQRILGNLVGLLVFAAVLPVARSSAAALVLCCLLFGFVTEACMSRNYWLGSVFVTPMALLVTTFAHAGPGAVLIADRALDTLTGAAAGLLAALLVANRRAAGRVERALTATAEALTATEEVLPGADPAALDSARRRLAARVVELRDAADTAEGEWWTGALPEQEVLRLERRAHDTLAAAARTRAPVAA